MSRRPAGVEVGPMKKRHWRAGHALLIVAALAGLAVAPVTPAPAAHAAAWTMTWHDEFDGPADTAPDGGRWGRDIGGGGWGNNEYEYYTNSTRNAALSGDGKL